MSSTFAGRVSPAIAKSRLETEPPDAVTVPVIEVGDDPEPEPELLPVPVLVLVPDPDPVQIVPPAEHPDGGAWHLLVVLSQYQPP